MPSPPVTVCRAAAQQRSVLALLDHSWPGIPVVIEQAAHLGAAWFDGSTAFAVFDGDQAIAHAGVLEIPMVIAGTPRRIAGVHAVCTHPDRRGEGLARAVLEAALEHCDRGFDAALLFAVEPAIYRRFGFRTIRENRFLVRAPTPARHGHQFRKLSSADPADVALVHRLCRERCPVSRQLGPTEPGWLFVLDEILARRGFDRLYYAEGLNVLAALEQDGRALNIYDLVAPTLPSMAEVLGALSFEVDRLRLHFAPDHFEAELTAEGAEIQTSALSGYALSGYDQLMVRGPFACEDQPIMVPPLARC